MNLLPKHNPLVRLLALSSPVLLFILLSWDRLPRRDADAYFAFADTRTFGFIPNAGDVLSNLAFLLVGAFALWQVLRPEAKNKPKNFRRLQSFAGLALIATGLGSSYFHWTPNVQTLFWDRVPMCFAFASIFALFVSDRIDDALAWPLFWVLFALAFPILINWQWGNGDLRPYILYQFGLQVAVLGVAIGSFSRPGSRIPTYALFAMIALYGLAKYFEHNDAHFFALLSLSGHTIKHLVAAVAASMLFVFQRK